MAGHRNRVLAGVVLAGAILTLAACTSGSSGGSGQSATQGFGVPVKNGTVVVKQGNKVICTMTVVNGKGTCNVSAKSLGVGTSQIVGTYNGTGYGNSKSAPLSVTVGKATTTTALTLSPATVSYGHEQAGSISVTITPKHGGTPTGTVAVESSNGATVCQIKLSGGQGACTLPANKLAVGSHVLIANYSGDQGYQASASVTETLTVTR